MGIEGPLLTRIRVKFEGTGNGEERIPVLEAICAAAPESMYQSLPLGACKDMLLRALIRADWSHVWVLGTDSEVGYVTGMIGTSVVCA